MAVAVVVASLLTTGLWVQVSVGAAWRVQSVHRAGTSELNGVSCASESACVAVGSGLKNGDSRAFAFAERYIDGSWRRQRLATYSTEAVSCRAEWCMSVGGYFNRLLAERWDGTRWAAQNLPKPPFGFGFYQPLSLASVSCATMRACVAVGATDSLTTVDCPPGITPVCDTEVPIAEQLIRGHWHLENLPVPVVAVESVPRPGNGPYLALESVSCALGDRCMAVGYWGAGLHRGTGNVHLFADRWSGQRWTLYSLPSPRDASYLSGEAVSCASADACTVVGSVMFDHRLRPFAERWNGRRWIVEHPVMPGAAGGASLSAVSCSAERSCAAVGYARGHGGLPRPFAERWNGARWRTISVPVPPGSHALSGSALSGVSCLARSCVAVGNYQTAIPSGWFIERYT